MTKRRLTDRLRKSYSQQSKTIRLALATVVGAACFIGISETARVVHGAPTAKPGAGGTCPAGFVLRAQSQQTAAIRNLGGSVESEHAEGSDAIENICVRIGSEEARKLPPPKATPTPKPRAANTLPTTDALGNPCKMYATAEIYGNTNIGRPGTSGLVIRSAPGTCFSYINVQHNLDVGSGAVSATNGTFGVENSIGNYELPAQK